MARSTPTLAQSVATLRNDGTIALGTSPTVGNLLVMVTAGFMGSLALYNPTGMARVGSFQSNVNNGVMAYMRRVQSGDTGSYPLTASDNQAAVLYEFSNACGVYPLAGGEMASAFSSASFNLWAPKSPFGINDVVLGAFEQDTTATWSISAETGLTVDYATTGAVNHTGAFIRTTSTHDGILSGSTSSAPTEPVFGFFAVVGTPS